MKDLSDAWLEMAQDAIKLAKEGRTLEEYRRFSNLVIPEVGKSYFDRIRVAEWLLTENLLAISDERLKLNLKTLPDWLKEGISSGDEKSWKLLHLLDTSGLRVNKFETSILSEIGLSGEKYVLECLKNLHQQKFHEQIIHVSLVDDSAGFDILTPKIENSNQISLLEVKTTTRNGDSIKVFLSRNEVEIAKRMANWYLVAVKKLKENFEIIGYLDHSDFEDFLPQDAESIGRWESVALMLPRTLFKSGLPI